MPLERLRVENFRCLVLEQLELDWTDNLIVGPNGAGKTSLLESIHVLGRGRSFRTRQTRRLIRDDSDGFAVFGEVVRSGAGRARLGVALGASGLEVRVDGRPVAGMAELADALVVEVLDPGAHALIEAGPSTRRRFIDAGVFHVEHSYLETWRDYRRALTQRNAALKLGARGASLEVWTEPLLRAGLRIDAARSAHAALLNEAFSHLGRTLLGAEVALAYRPGWRRGLSLEEALAESVNRDREAGFTQPGPHRADVRIQLNGRLAETHASRGQQKLVGAALVLAETACLRAAGVEGLVLLVDDPAAELDAGALERLIEQIRGLDVQCVLTAIRADMLPFKASRTFHVEQGRIKAVV